MSQTKSIINNTKSQPVIGSDYLCDSHNYGISLLKMLMCFEVVLIHFWKEPVSSFLIPFDILKGLAVPTFIYIAFYYSVKTFESANNKKKYKRLFRLIYPLFGWAIIYWIIYLTIQLKINLA